MEYYVISRFHDCRTGRHVDRSGPLSEAEAREQAELRARRPNTYSVYICQGSPYGAVLHKIK
jgi:hypothetical protein